LLLWVDALPPWHCLVCRKPLRCCILFLQAQFVSYEF
jgi:hypothetical protein